MISHTWIGSATQISVTHQLQIHLLAEPSTSFVCHYKRATRPTRPAPTTCCTCTLTAGARPELVAAADAIDALFDTLLRLWLTLAVTVEALALIELKLALAALEALLAAEAFPDALDRREDSTEEILADAETTTVLIDESLLEATELAELRFEDSIDVADAGLRDALEVSTSVEYPIEPPPPP